MERLQAVFNYILDFVGGDALLGFSAVFTFLSRFVLAALAVIILFRCTKSLLSGKSEPEVCAYLSLPNGGRIAMHHWENVIGRSKACDLVLNYPTISRNHCALIRDKAGAWTAIDLSSKSGVRVSGEPVDSSVAVEEGDILEIGGVEVTLLELRPEEIQRQNQERTKPGRFIRPSGTMFFITLFQAFLCVQLSLTAGEDFTAAIPLSFAALAGIMWFYFFFVRAMRRTGFEIESIAFFLTSIGFAVVATTNPDDMFKQVAMLAAGVVTFFLLCWILRNLRLVKKLRWPAGVLGILALAATYLLAESVYGAKNWISIGGMTIQPSEFVKVAFIFSGAATLDRLFARRNLFLFIGYSGMCVGVLALMSDFGSALVFFSAFLIIAFLRSGDLATIVLAIASAVFAVFLIVMIRPYVADRFSTWGSAWGDPYGTGMQQVLTMSYTASGGLFGLGAGSGNLKDVVFAYTDLVFGIVCEELGLIIGLCVIASFVVMGLFVIKASASARSSFYVIGAGAAVTIMLMQLMLNVFGSLDVLPFTGVTLPFVSMGGSSLLACWCMLAFIKAVDTRQNASFAAKLSKRVVKRGKRAYEDSYEEDDGEWEDGTGFEGEYDGADEAYEYDGGDDVEYGDDYDDDYGELDPRYFDDNWDK